MTDADKRSELAENFKKIFWPPVQEEKQRYQGPSSFYHCRLCERTDSPAQDRMTKDGGMQGRAILYYEMPETYNNEQLGLVIPKGSVTFAYYWTDRPYNLYHMIDPNGETLGYYFNVADRTVMEETGLRWRDLIVDVFVRHDSVRVLDEDEIPQTIEPEILDYILQSRDLLIDRHRDIIDEISQISTRLWNMRNRMTNDPA